MIQSIISIILISYIIMYFVLRNVRQNDHATAMVALLIWIFSPFALLVTILSCIIDKFAQIPKYINWIANKLFPYKED